MIFYIKYRIYNLKTIPRSLSTFNVALEVGRMGTIKNNLVKETYFNISVSMSIFDKWFIKKKYK